MLGMTEQKFYSPKGDHPLVIPCTVPFLGTQLLFKPFFALHAEL